MPRLKAHIQIAAPVDAVLHLTDPANQPQWRAIRRTLLARTTTENWEVKSVNGGTHFMFQLEFEPHLSCLASWASSSYYSSVISSLSRLKALAESNLSRS